jgi:hypothetical protein
MTMLPPPRRTAARALLLAVIAWVTLGAAYGLGASDLGPQHGMQYDPSTWRSLGVRVLVALSAINAFASLVPALLSLRRAPLAAGAALLLSGGWIVAVAWAWIRARS